MSEANTEQAAEPANTTENAKSSGSNRGSASTAGSSESNTGSSGSSGSNAGSSGSSGSSGGKSRGKGREGRGRGRDDKNQFVEHVVTINRVAKVVKGGRRFSFTALVVVGDADGMVGVGYGKAKEVPAAIAKGVEEAKKNFFRVPRIRKTIPHPIQGEDAAGVVVMRPAAPGSGVKAGGPVRAVLDCAGIHDVLTKSLGTQNQLNIVRATINALRGLERPEQVAARRGMEMDEVTPPSLLRAASEGGA